MRYWLKKKKTNKKKHQKEKQLTHPLPTQASCRFEEKEQNELRFDSSVLGITLRQWFPAANTHSGSESGGDYVQAKHKCGWRDSQQIRQLFFVPIHKIQLGHPGYIKGTFLGWADACWAVLQAPVMLISGALIQHFQQLPKLADGDPLEWDLWNTPEGLIFSLRLSKSQSGKHTKSILTLNHNEMLSKRLDLQKASCKQRQPLVISVTSILRSLLRSTDKTVCPSQVPTSKSNHAVHLESSCCHASHNTSLESLYPPETQGCKWLHFSRVFLVVLNLFLEIFVKENINIRNCHYSDGII